MNGNLVSTRQARIAAGLCWLAVGIAGLAASFMPPDWMAQAWKLWPLIPLSAGLASLWGIDFGFGSRASAKRD